MLGMGRPKIHGHSHGDNGAGTPTYCAWRSMKTRCLNPNTRYYVNYGGRGIKVCERWLSSFANFLADMGEKPAGMSLDRIDVNGEYEHANCRWATMEEQRNNARNTPKVTFEGLTLGLAQWA